MTFVFTDIEGSTKLLRQLDSDYADLLCTHRLILRDVWSRFDGHELGGEGDSFLVAFEDPANAVEACIEGQRRLTEHRWVHGVQVRVRMGIHRGLAVPLGDEYFSLTVHQAARVVAAAAGRQVLMTAAVANELTGVTARSAVHLGAWTVRDFDAPVDLFGLQRDGVPMQLGEPATGHVRTRSHGLKANVPLANAA